MGGLAALQNSELVRQARASHASRAANLIKAGVPLPSRFSVVSTSYIFFICIHAR